MSNQKVLSVQSHVVSGMVGNKMSGQTMRVMGISVDEINTVHFSNPSNYKVLSGTELSCDELTNIYEALKINILNEYTHVLTGYVRRKDVLLKLKDIIVDLKSHGDFKTYFCDPVLGDNGRFYVPYELLDIYKNSILPVADVLIPNKFEAEQLSGLPLSANSEDINSVLKRLHEFGPRKVIISSIDDDCFMTTVASEANADGTFRARKIRYRRSSIKFVGSGDLFSALIVSFYIKSDGDLETTTISAVSMMQDIITAAESDLNSIMWYYISKF